MAKRKKRVSVTNATVDRLLSNATLVREIGCLTNAKKIKKKCGKCKNAPVKEVYDHNTIKKCIGAMSGSQLTFLKNFLKADTIVISYTVSSGKTVTKPM